MKSLASCTVRRRLSCRLHFAAQRAVSQAADFPAGRVRRHWHAACDAPGPAGAARVTEPARRIAMSQATQQLNELIEITRDGQRFYQHAIDEVKDAELQHLFRDMAQAKTQIIQALTVKVAANHEQPAQGGTLAGRIRELYADTKARLGNASSTYVEQLEQAEERILRAFEDALQDAQPDIRALLAVELPKLRACHTRMRQLKQSLAWAPGDSCKTPGLTGILVQIKWRFV